MAKKELNIVEVEDARGKSAWRTFSIRRKPADVRGFGWAIRDCGAGLVCAGWRMKMIMRRAKL